jgi:hypothetical protein
MANGNKMKSRSMAEKREAVERILSQQLSGNGNSSHNVNIVEPTRKETRPLPNPKSDSSSQNIEIVTKENSVSEIRIYSGTKCLNISPEPIVQPKANAEASGSGIHYAASDIFKINASRPQSTSVVLIMNSESEKMKVSSTEPPVPPPLPPLNNNWSKGRIEGTRPAEMVEEPLYDDVIAQASSLPGKKSVLEEAGPKTLRNDTPPPNAPPPVPPPNRKSADDTESLQSVYSDVGGEGSSMTVSISNANQQEPSSLVYDDTLSLRSTAYEARPPPNRQQERREDNHNHYQAKESLPRLINHSQALIKEESLVCVDEEEPLYDDVLNLISSHAANVNSGTMDRDSDSGTETDIPPPLPASGPPLLPKISMDLPLIPLPSLPGVVKVKSVGGGNSISKGTSRLFGEIKSLGKKMSRGDSSESKIVENQKEPEPEPESVLLLEESYSDVSSCNTKFLLDLPQPVTAPAEEDDLVLDRTRTLLNELNDKLAKLSFSPSDYSKTILPSSSESSGVEEDYNSERNYSLSNGSGGSSTTSLESESYKLSAVSKLVTETISMARGKFLDSMKIQQQKQQQQGLKEHEDGEDEPIYEEICEGGDAEVGVKALVAASSFLRSTSPIYADAFDAKSIFDGASRSEILSFLESIRDRLTAAESHQAQTVRD